jgi:hypothetical protein
MSAFGGTALNPIGCLENVGEEYQGSFSKRNASTQMSGGSKLGGLRMWSASAISIAKSCS